MEHFFQDYENEANLIKNPTDKMLAEIAVKDMLLLMSKRATETELAKIQQKKFSCFENVEDLIGLKELDADEFEEEMLFHKGIANRNETGGYQVLFWKVLPYVIPIAAQSAIALPSDMEGKKVNDVYDYNPNIRMQYMHLCFFPLKNQSVVLAFYHKRDKLSKASVTSYLPYRKGVYFPSTAEKGKISVGAERQRRYRAMKRWRDEPTEESFWGVVLAYAGVKFKTYSGLPFSYEIKKGRNGEYTKELWIDRREKSKSLSWGSVLLALGNIKEEMVDRPQALGDIRGVTYIYGMFYRFGLIDVPDDAKEKMGHPQNRKK